MVVLAPAPPLEVKFCNWRTTSFIALIHLGLLILPTPSTPISRFIPYLNFTCLVYCTCFSFCMSACFSPFNQFCHNIFYNLQVFIQHRFVRGLSRLLVYYSVFCLLVFPLSAIIRCCISVFVSSFFPPWPSFPSLPYPISCCGVVSCLAIGNAARFIMKSRVVGLLGGT